MPFAGYPDMDACIADNQEKDDPGAYCAVIKRAVEGSQFSIVDGHDGRKLLLSMEIFATGYHVPAQGEARMWDSTDLRAMLEAYRAGVPGAVHLKIGHTSDGFCNLVAEKLGVPAELVQGEGPAGDGMISLGRMIDLRYRDDGILVADWEVPAQIAELVGTGYADVSTEIMGGYEGYPWVISAVALLGAERPAIDGLEGLADMVLLADRQPALVARFKSANGKLVFSGGGMKDIDLENIETTLEPAIKGRQGESKFRQMWADIKSKFANRQEGDVEEKRVREALGLKDGDDIVEAVVALKARADKPSVSEFTEAKFTEAIKARDEEIASLKRVNLVAHYKAVASTLTAVEGKPEDIAERLTTLHERAGEDVATATLADLQKQQELASKAGLFTAIGSARPGDPSRHELEGEMEEWSKTTGKSPAEALAHFRAVQPGRFNEYRRAIRNGGGE